MREREREREDRVEVDTRCLIRQHPRWVSSTLYVVCGVGSSVVEPAITELASLNT